MTTPDPIAQAVVDHEAKYNAKGQWHEKGVAYWFNSLVEEIGELGQALNGEHEHPPETELVQIGAIAIGFLRQLKRLEERGEYDSTRPL